MAEHDRRSIYERRRNIIYLIAEYLKEAGLSKTHASLIDESQLSNEFVICDNVDLETIYMEFCSYYFVKFGKKPRFVKKNDAKLLQPQTPSAVCSSTSTSDIQAARQALAKKRASLKTISNATTDLETSQCLQISSLSPTNIHESDEKISIISSPGIFMKSMHEFYNSHPHDWRDVSEVIIKDIVRKNLLVKWDDIIGLDEAKMILRESVVFPMKYPELFNRIQSWKAVLIHGVPGCGKTLLARALCSELHETFTFFNVSASTLISKWRGESEKLIRVLFELAKYHEPSIIFIDELDSLTSKRCALSEHEATKRLKNEFLSLLDGLESDESSRVFVLGSTNLPWDIDTAFLRRFERKIHIDVPTMNERQNLIKHFLPSSQKWRLDELEELAMLSENFTGDDIRVAIKEANMMIIRKKIRSENFSNSIDMDIECHHLKEALKHVKPNPENDINKHRQWISTFCKT
ncbi:hypothetical protein PVAND_003037 [Polypedilum vanderplanki]|uniref:AAA+ ATPase domain-containing protein n=1 Tax=Polypedilum vanderplanki TaxID=319348 RepID=A0A9J6BUH8_POLVA|nr:hypothetical protein PVAND_003037 [Polypedilum vanderplanki]